MAWFLKQEERIGQNDTRDRAEVCGCTEPVWGAAILKTKAVLKEILLKYHSATSNGKLGLNVSKIKTLQTTC